MKILTLAQDYLGAVAAAYAADEHIALLPADQQVERALQYQTYLGDSYQCAFRALGHEAHTLFPECMPLQRAWAEEHGYAEMLTQHGAQALLTEQVRRYSPDVLYIHSGVYVDESLMRTWRQYAGLMVSQWSCKLVDVIPYHSFDLIVSTARNFVQEFAARGIPAVHVQHAFDERQVPAQGITRDVVFAGALLPQHHLRRIEDLAYIAAHVPLEFYGHGVEQLPAHSPLRAAYRGPAWGTDMLAVLASSRICLHLPGDAVAADAGSKRLFEVTGMGSLLLAQRQPGLSELFEDGREIVTFTDPADCVRKIRYYLEHEDERAAIAMRGRQRTLRDHTVTLRAQELLVHLQKARASATTLTTAAGLA